MNDGSRTPSAGARPRRRPARQGNRVTVVATILGVLIVVAIVLGGVLPIILDFANRPADEAALLTTPTPGPSAYEGELRAALAASPDDPVLMTSLANLLVALDRPEEAIEWFEQAVAANPEQVQTRLDFGLALARMGSRADAEVQFQRVLAIAPENPDALLLLGEVYLFGQPPDVNAARTSFTAAIAAAPDSVAALRAREHLAQMGDATPAASPASSPTG